jgi:hypothetical protein
MPPNSLRDGREQREPVGAQRGIRIVDHHVLEELRPSPGRSEASSRRARRRSRARRPRGRTSPSMRLERRVQGAVPPSASSADRFTPASRPRTFFRMLAMRLFAAARLAASGRCWNAASARRRASKSSGPRAARREHRVEQASVVNAGNRRPRLRPSRWPSHEIIGAQPLHHEGSSSAAAAGASHRLGCERRGDRSGPQVEVEALLDDDAQHADRGAAQAEGILRARGLLANREDAGERVERRRARPRCRCGVAGSASPAPRGCSARAPPARLRPARHRRPRSTRP